MTSRRRIATALVLLAATTAPSDDAGWLSMPAPVQAAASPIVWTVRQHTFDPAQGRVTLTSTFGATNPDYLVEIVLSSSESSDEVYVQLGDDLHDATQVQSGEDRFFVATHLKPGMRLTLHVIADPKHDYGGRTLAYAARVMSLPDLPFDVDGTAASKVSNVLAFNAPRAGTYTIHYQLDSGSAHLLTYAGNTAKDSGRLAGEGGISMTLPAGPSAVALEQDPGGYVMHWSLGIGRAPSVRDFQPADSSILHAPPATISVIASPGSTLQVDHQAVHGQYDPHSRQLTYRPAQPLAAGVHEVSVIGSDGTPATTNSRFEILPPANLQPPSTPAGSYYGVPWVTTSTPDGRYTLLMPAGWVIGGDSGTIVLAEPHGGQFIFLSERFLSAAVSATSIAQRLEQALATKMRVTGTPKYAGSEGRVGVFAMVKANSGADWANVDLVLPRPDRNSLLLGLGFDTTATSDGVNTVAKIETSLSTNDEAGIVAARRWQTFDRAGLNLEYPEGWAANFASTSGVWFAGPSDQAIMYAFGLPYGGTTDGGLATSFGRLVTALIKTRLHADLKLVDEQSSTGVYRWLATFSSSNKKSVGIEYGQAVLANGKVEAMWGDTDLEQLPTNLPLFGHILDSAAQGTGLNAPTALNLAVAAHVIGADTPSAAAQGQTVSPAPSSGAPAPQGSAAGYLGAYQGLVDRGNDYTFMSNMMMNSYAAGMNIAANIGDSGDYYAVTDSY